MKTCTICNATKQLTDFYKNRLLLYPYCKTCFLAKERTRRAANRDKYREAASIRAQTPKNKATRKAYLASDRGKLAMKRSNENQKKKYPERILARKTMILAILRGDLIRKPCEVCGNENSDGHHEDYSKPLDIIWYCRKHHVERHKQIRRNMEKMATVTGGSGGVSK